MPSQANAKKNMSKYQFELSSGLHRLIVIICVIWGLFGMRAKPALAADLTDLVVKCGAYELEPNQVGEYEIQILDSFGRTELGMGDMGAIYGAAVPTQNASKAPGQWQKYVIDYRAPRFDAAGKKTANARIVKITLNGQVIHQDVEMKNATPGGVSGKEAPTGPLMFQGNHGEVAYRNIQVTPVGK